MKFVSKWLIASALTSQCIFAAGYILPNGTILYDNSSDTATYKVESLSPQQAPMPAQPQIQQNNPEQVVVKSVVIENKTVVYEQPVYIRERVIDRRPFYDVVDVAGAVLAYGLIYDTARHSFITMSCT